MVLYFAILKNIEKNRFKIVKKLEVNCQDSDEGWAKAQDYQDKHRISGSLFSVISKQAGDELAKKYT